MLASECTQKPRWRVWEYTYDGVWENVRYELEMELLKTRRRHLWSYFSAMYYTDWGGTFVPGLRLRGYTRLEGGESIVLVRKPFPRALAKTSPAGNVCTRGVFVPPHFRINLGGRTEDERLAEVMSQNMNIFTKKNELQHPNEYTYDGIVPQPPDTYVCNGCGTGGHFRADCGVAEEVEGHRSLDRVRRPHGIPKSQLRRVEKGERSDAMVDAEGNYVVREMPGVKGRRVDDAGNVRKTPRELDVVPKPGPQTPPVQPVDWMLADHFSVSNHSPPRYATTYMVSGLEVDVGLEIEASVRRVDTLTREAEREFYTHNPSKRRKRDSTCTHWLRGLCVKGALECEFMHNAGPEYMPICKFFYNGVCSNEDVCVFRHVTKVVPLDPCPDFVHGFCPKGGECELGHVKRTTPCFSDWAKCGFSRVEFNHALDYM